MKFDATFYAKRSRAIHQIRKLEARQGRALREYVLTGDAKSKAILESIEKGILSLREYIASLSVADISKKIDEKATAAKAEIGEIRKAG